MPLVCVVEKLYDLRLRWNVPTNFELSPLRFPELDSYCDVPLHSTTVIGIPEHLLEIAPDLVCRMFCSLSSKLVHKIVDVRLFQSRQLYIGDQ